MVWALIDGFTCILNSMKLNLKKDEIEADLALEAQLEQLVDLPQIPLGLFSQRGRTVSEQFLNEKFAAKIERGEFNEKTYKQCIADELLQENVTKILLKVAF